MISISVFISLYISVKVCVNNVVFNFKHAKCVPYISCRLLICMLHFGNAQLVENICK